MPTPTPAALTAAEACALVAMVGRGDGWPTKAAVVLAIGSVEGGDWITSPEMAAATGLGQGHVRRLLAQLDEERVILRDSPGGAQRRWWVEVNPRWEEWRVPWRVSRADVRRQLALTRERANQRPVERLIARPMHARTEPVIARLMARDQKLARGELAPYSRVHSAREQGASPEPDRASMARANGMARSRTHARASSEGVSEEELLSVPGSPPTHSDGAEVARPAPGEGEREVEGLIVDAADWDRVRRAVVARCLGQGGRRPFISGRCAHALADLLQRHGADEVVASAERVEAHELMPPRFVQALGEVAGAVDELTGCEQLGVPDPAAIRGRLQGIDRLIAQYEADGAAEAPLTLRAEAEQLREQLAELKASTASTVL